MKKLLIKSNIWIRLILSFIMLAICSASLSIGFNDNIPEWGLNIYFILFIILTMWSIYGFKNHKYKTTQFGSKVQKFIFESKTTKRIAISIILLIIIALIIGKSTSDIVYSYYGSLAIILLVWCIIPIVKKLFKQKGQ